MTDLRPSIETPLDAWGFDVTVAAPGGLPVETRAFWLPTSTPQTPAAAAFRRAEPRRVLVVPVEGLSDGLPRESVILAPEYDGATAINWKVDSTERVDADHWRVSVVPES